MARRILLGLLFVAVACGSDTTTNQGADAGADAQPPGDGGTDAQPADAGPQDASPGDAEADAGAIPGSELTYSEPRAACRDRNPLRNAYFGDLHVHTSLSFDAYSVDNRNDATMAYRFARGETIRLAPLDGTGQGTRPVKLDRPLDFAAATDHSEYLGEVSICSDPSATGYDSLVCRAYRSGGRIGFAEFGAKLTLPRPDRFAFCGPSDALCLAAEGRVWKKVQDAAETAYDRTADCRFTSFAAYEWTGTTLGANLHRNVIFRNAKVPARPVSYYDEPTAPGLWATLRQRCNTGTPGCDVLAIPHNSNLSNGKMFAVEYPLGSTRAEQKLLAELRAQMEPVAEMVQHKGASECNRSFSANDEACDLEVARDADPCTPLGVGPCKGRGDYVRYALQSGMEEEARIGVNPHKIGVIASTDTHNSTPGNTAERDFPGHAVTEDDEPDEQLAATFRVFGPGGLAGVWAVENSRDAIFDAIRRRETFGTSGTRMRVRMFGGWGFPANLCADPALVRRGYTEGVPQGGTMPDRVGTSSPRFVVMATADQTPLQRVEIVKVWIDGAGNPRERVSVISGSATNGASVDTDTCTTTPGSGQMSACGVWTDDQYEAGQRAAYYARVVENPTCRWSTYVCNKLGPARRPAACTDGSMPRTLQELAWSSPIFSAAR